MEWHDSLSPSGLTLAQAQQSLYDFLLEIVKTWSPEAVLEEFRRLFIQYVDSVGCEALPALHVILCFNNEVEFRHTIKRCCYILVNNWEVMRRFEFIQSLVDLFADPSLQQPSLSPTVKRLRQWLSGFAASPDFADLKLFAARLTEDRTVNRPGDWVNRYASYLLVPQYINEANPFEQRQAARALSRRLKDQFKFDLAMYTAYSQAAIPPRRSIKNPTALGDSVLRLIKAIVAKRGDFSYRNLARLFLEQTKGTRYETFKTNLTKYLLYQVSGTPMAEQIDEYLKTRLNDLYTDYNDEPLDASLLLRTCNRIIDYLMTEDQEIPSPLFSLVLSQGHALSLAIILLKVVLISRSSQLYLEVRIADLIRYYEQFPRDQCQWVINFLEVFQVTFAIHAENIEYSLVRIDGLDLAAHPALIRSWQDLEAFRVFSQKLRLSSIDLDTLSR